MFSFASSLYIESTDHVEGEAHEGQLFVVCSLREHED